FIVPKVTGSLLLKILAQVIGVAMISGIVRMIRGGSAILVALFAAASAVLLSVWSFPPNERFVLPLFPLALAGLLVESRHFVELLRAGRRHQDAAQRRAALGVASFAMALAAALVVLQLYVGAVYLPEDARQHRARNASRDSVYAWIRANTAPAATILSTDDALLYLHTGRQAMRRPVPPFLWYREDDPGMIAWLGEPQEFARRHGLSYFDFSGAGISLGVKDETGVAIAEKIHSSTAFDPLFAQGPVTFYSIRPNGVARAGALSPRIGPLPQAQ
ncbi:MAG: hypothetical protein ABI995_15200, partial [Acidobacteriota bacterium]